LLVDDDGINQKVMSNLLRRRGCEPVTATSGKQSLDLLEQQHFDLILMDIQMPELDGFETATIIRQREIDPATPRPSNRRVPIVALTTVSAPGTRERCLEAGMDGYLTKPINTDDLDRVISGVLSRAY
jgi:CheY-like chemotaxis protein